MAKSNYKVLLGACGALIVTVCVAASSWAIAPGGRSFDPDRMLERLSHKLDLSEEQQAEVRPLLAESLESIAADRQRFKELRKAMAEQRRDFDAGTAQSMANELGEITARMIYARTSTKAQVYALLTEEQQAQMDDMAQRRKEHKRHRRMHRFGA